MMKYIQGILLKNAISALIAGASTLTFLGSYAALPALAVDDIPQDLLDAEEEFKSTLTLIGPYNEAPVIVVGADATESEQYAAQELSKHLQKMTGRQVEIAQDNAIPPGKKLIAIGNSTLTQEYDISALGVEQYIIDVQPERLVILGGKSQPPITNAEGKVYVNDRGTLYGVYEFLEDQGVRWYRPEAWGWHIPKKETIELPIGKKISEPPAFIGRTAVRFTNYLVDEKQRRELQTLTKNWSARQRLTERVAGPNAKLGGDIRLGLGHAYTKLIPPAKYLAEHPEYFALVNGERGNSGSGRTPQLCLGNTELQEVFAQNVVQQARENPQMYSIAVDPEDGTQPGQRMCTCSLCMAMDDPAHPGNMSNRVFAFTNIIARKAAEEIPGIKLGLYAYSSHTQVPTIVDKLEPNIIVATANINAWTDWSKKMLDPNSPQNARFVKLVKDWQDVAPHKLWMREYSAYGWMGPMPMYRLLQDRFQTYRDLGFEGITGPTEPDWGAQLLLIYFKSQLQWKPDLDMEKELNLFYTNYYGPAAQPMKAYHEKWVATLENSQVGDGLSGGIWSGGRGMHLLCTPALIKELGNYITAAEKAVKGKPLYEQRLRGTKTGYEFSKQISKILSLKMENGEVKKNPRASTTFLSTPKAEQKWEELLQWLKGTNNDEITFDIRLQNGNVTATPLMYMKRDILENGRYSQWDEKILLKAQGFDTKVGN